MSRGAFRGAATAWLGLVTLQVLTSNGGSGKVSGALGVVNDVVKRAISPDVAAIPDHSKGGSGAGLPAAGNVPSSFLGGFTTGQLAAAGAAAGVAANPNVQSNLNQIDARFGDLNLIGIGNLAALRGLTPKP